tara:strand:- start:367 stop:600 length:234 start_codon:yes stop_codon:yes gene_type:complete
MEFITSLFSRSSIVESPKLEINTLNTQFLVDTNAIETYQKLLNYSINNTIKQNDYKTTVKLITDNKTYYFSTYSKII